MALFANCRRRAVRQDGPRRCAQDRRDSHDYVRSVMMAVRSSALKGGVP